MLAPARMSPKGSKWTFVAMKSNGSSGPTSAECAGRISFLKVDPLRERQSILDVDTEIAHRAVHLRMAKQQLDRPQVSGLLVDLRHLGSPHRMCTVGARLQSDRYNPSPDDPGILSRRQMRTAMDSAGPKELQADHFGVVDPALERQPRRLGDFEPDRLRGLSLDHRRSFLDTPSSEYIPDPETDERGGSGNLNSGDEWIFRATAA